MDLFLRFSNHSSCQIKLAIPPTSYKGSLGPFGPECPGECPRKQGCLTECPTECLCGPKGSVSGALRATGSGVSKKCPESVPRVSGTPFSHSGDTLGTLFGHTGTRGSKGPGDTPLRATETLRGTLRQTPTPRDTRARETPVAGRRDRKILTFFGGNFVLQTCRHKNFENGNFPLEATQ